MPKVTIIQVIHNHRRFIEPVFSAIFNQAYKDFNVVAVISGNEDGGKELLMEKFPQVEIIDPGYNIGFAAGHNLVFERYRPNFFQLVNPDLIMEPNYIEEMLKVFTDEKVGAATGKLLRYDFDKHQKTNIIDSTGVTISKSGRARDRGQHEVDGGQYDNNRELAAVSAAGAMYRREALQNIQLPIPNFQSRFEYFDEDFHSYWEDVDLAWRMTNAGWRCIYQPTAVGYHGRSAGSSKGGYIHVADFISHHKKLSADVKRLNYKNHIFMYIKNSPYFYLQFFVRDFFMFFYILFFEISTLKVVPEMLQLMPKMFWKRKIIKKMMASS